MKLTEILMKKHLLILLALLPQFLFSQTRIIDMHIHSYTESDFGVREPSATDHYGVRGSANAEQHRIETFAAFERFNIVKAAFSGNPESVRIWKEKDKDNRVIKGILSISPDDYDIDIERFEQMIKAGEIEIFGELGPY